MDVTETDEGDYVCEANNGVGSPLAARVKLQVRVPAHFAKNYDIIKSRNGEDAVLRCDVRGDPPITVIWSKDREPIVNRINSRYSILNNDIHKGLSSVLSIKHANVSDSGFFTCSARNEYGDDDNNIQLIVEGPPDAPTVLQIAEIQSRQVTLSWLKPHDGNSPVLSYLVQYIKENGMYFCLFYYN